MKKWEEKREFLKESLADALLGLLKEKPFDRITVDEIVQRSGVGRMTYFRCFHSKEELVTCKMRLLWMRYAEQHNLRERRRFSYDNALPFFQYNYEIRDTLRLIYRAGLQDALFNSFTEIMLPPDTEDVNAWYREKFYSYGLYGALDGWIRRDFAESVEQMAELIRHMR